MTTLLGVPVTHILVAVHAGEDQRTVATVILSIRVGLVVQQQQLQAVHIFSVFICVSVSTCVYVCIYSP